MLIIQNHSHIFFQTALSYSSFLCNSKEIVDYTSMAAYGALVSLMHIIENLELHPRPPISLDKEQVRLLTENVTFLQEFLEVYNSHLGYSTEADPMEIRIADAAYAAEDAIESHIVDQSTSNGEKMSSDALYESVQKVLDEMSLMKKEAMEIKTNVTQLPGNSMLHESAYSSSSVAQDSSMVGADAVKLQMMEELTSNRLDLQIIPIVGMGGTGKTTLARNIYQEGLIKEHFDICAWTTISQEYSIVEILAEVLLQLNSGVGQGLSEDELGGILHKHIYGRRYLIILDDMWSIHAWDRVRKFFPDCKDGSRIVVTTRLSNLASDLAGPNSLEMQLLDEADSWDLLSKTVFGEKGCPPELEETGKKIGLSCKGLPLSIVVVGGLLAKSKHTREFWEYIEGNLNSVVNLEDGERCLKILYMSYKQLPVYLKPCFLYMGVYPEDEEIRISKLIRLWVAEGFLKPISGKSLEEAASLYLKELIDRNLILINKIGSTGNIKECKIHDLLRDLCLREGQKERFHTTIVARAPSPQGVGNAAQRRVVVPNATSKSDGIDALSSMPSARSLTWYLNHDEIMPSLDSKLLRILDSNRFKDLVSAQLPENLHQLVNSRFIAISNSSYSQCRFSPSIWQFWNLQTVIIIGFWKITVPSDIWYKTSLRHLQLDDLYLPNPPNGQDDVVLPNLQTLGRVLNFKCGKQMVKRFPNIKKLKIYGLDDRHFLSNLDRLDKLESLKCVVTRVINISLQRLINFPHSLKKLDLRLKQSQCWEEILDKIGALPLLQKLIIIGGKFKERQWETTEGQFRSLKFLILGTCNDLYHWTTESSHFPCLERLYIKEVCELEEIPLDFAEISTLKVIEVYRCSDSVVVSAKRILDEQEDLYGDETALQVRITHWTEDEELKSMESSNFHFTWL